ncbi:hypothetical protein BDD12DRAFT_733234 [Trichophaea hybrida]|nr:hypothetical protein BDD12DRAFT_733234 [Trichophaea hybrida]
MSSAPAASTAATSLTNTFILRCANSLSKCEKPGTSVCSGCNLYCSQDCQRDHWKAHKSLCKSPLSKENWDPEWFTSNRTPAFMTNEGGPLLSTCGMNKYLLGNMPAFDHIKLEQNEGSDWEKPLDLCFAASGDLRNILVTVNSLPSRFKNPCNVIINDREMYVVLRNMLLLRILSAFPPTEAAEMALHLWYSAKLPSAMCQKLRESFSESFKKISVHMDKAASKSGETLLSTSFELGEKAKMHCVLPRAYWTELFSMLNLKMSSQEATEVRHRITMNKDRRDYRERHLSLLPPNCRVAKQQFYEDGLLLPLGADRSEFTEANFTLFDSHGGGWMLNDSAEPLNCWGIRAVLANGTAPKNDLYGLLYFYLLPQLEKFATRLRTEDLHFTLLSVDARKIAHAIQSCSSKHGVTSFDRIDVSNLSDRGYIGIPDILRLISPLLKTQRVNPHAVLITLFLNYHAEIEQTRPREYKESMTKNVDEATKYLPRKLPRSHGDPFLLKVVEVQGFLKDSGKLWELYQRDNMFEMAAELSGMKQRKVGKIIATNPYRLRKEDRKEKVLEQIDLMQISGLNGAERYVEWVRNDEEMLGGVIRI